MGKYCVSDYQFIADSSLEIVLGWFADMQEKYGWEFVINDGKIYALVV